MKEKSVLCDVGIAGLLHDVVNCLSPALSLEKKVPLTQRVGRDETSSLIWSKIPVSPRGLPACDRSGVPASLQKGWKRISSASHK